MYFQAVVDLNLPEMNNCQWRVLFPSSLNVYLDLIQCSEKQLLIILQNVMLHFVSDFIILFTNSTSDNFFTTELQPETTGAPLFSFKLRANQQFTETQWKAKATQKNLLTGIH